MALTKAARSSISGSQAALRMTVVPCAMDEASMRFSVAPTLGKSSTTSAPCRPCGVDASMKPWSVLNCTPRASRLVMCMSSLRAPIWQPPGMATRAQPKRAIRGPRMLMEALILATSS